VAGFPLGATTTAAKVFEAQQAMAEGAHEVDMVLAIGRLKAGDYAAVRDDMAQVVDICRMYGAHCKVIVETALLDDAEKITACLLALQVGADFVKTSTGFAASGANVHDVALMRRVVGASAGVKAAGGIRTRHDAETMLEAGANRLGSSASVHLVSDT
jgi:deoxyribose-phosphate aldolase